MIENHRPGAISDRKTGIALNDLLAQHRPLARFPERCRVNRGDYRELERYCAKNPGVLCFSRPLYRNPTACPAQVEFGVLKTSGELWVQVFENV